MLPGEMAYRMGDVAVELVPGTILGYEGDAFVMPCRLDMSVKNPIADVLNRPYENAGLNSKALWPKQRNSSVEPYSAHVREFLGKDGIDTMIYSACHLSRNHKYDPGISMFYSWECDAWKLGGRTITNIMKAADEHGVKALGMPFIPEVFAHKRSPGYGERVVGSHFMNGLVHELLGLAKSADPIKITMQYTNQDGWDVTVNAFEPIQNKSIEDVERKPHWLNLDGDGPLRTEYEFVL